MILHWMLMCLWPLWVVPYLLYESLVAYDYCARMPLKDRIEASNWTPLTGYWRDLLDADTGRVYRIPARLPHAVCAELHSRSDRVSCRREHAPDRLPRDRLQRIVPRARAMEETRRNFTSGEAYRRLLVGGDGVRAEPVGVSHG